MEEYKLNRIALILIISLSVWNFNPQVVKATKVNPPGIAITVDGKLVKTEVSPIISSGRTMVPLRAVGEALHLQVGWNPTNQVINLTSTGLNLILTIGSRNALLNNWPLNMDTSPMIINGRTLVPLRFISEAVGCEVKWNEANRTVIIDSSPEPLKLLAYYALGNSQSSSWNDLFVTTYPEVSSGNTDIVNEVALGWYTLDQMGTLSTQSQGGWAQPQGWGDVLQATNQFDLNTQMTVHMTDKEGAIVNLLTSEAAQDAAITSIIQAVDLYDGVNLDFEGLGWNDTGADLLRVQQLFTRFTNKLALTLHQSGKTLALSLHPQNSAYLGYDYRTLGSVADQIIIMAYDYGPKPEPLDRVKQAITMAQTMVPGEKIYLGISVPSETVESIGDKIALASNSKLAGIAIWRLGLISDAMWEKLKNNPAIARKGVVRGSASYDLYHQPSATVSLSPPGQLNGGDKVQILQRIGEWTQVKKNYLKGWLPNWYLQEGLVSPVNVEPHDMVINRDDNLYLYPDGVVIQAIVAGKQMRVTKICGDWSYVEVTGLSGINQGWVNNAGLSNTD